MKHQPRLALLGRRLAFVLCVGALLSVVAAGCSAPQLPLRLGSQRVLSLHIVVEELPSEDRYVVRYVLSQPAAGLRFARSHSLSRRDSWSTVADEQRGVRWQRVSGSQPAELLLANPAGEGRARFAVDFAADYTERAGDYRLNYKFSDGGRLLYTGQLLALPLVCPKSVGCEAHELRLFDGPMRLTWTFRTAGKRDVQVALRRGSPALSFAHDPATFREGTYAYFGELEAENFDFGLMIVDPRAPKWMVRDTRELLRRVVAHYRAKLRLRLRIRPLIFLSFSDARMRGRNLKGGGLDGVLQLAAEGYDWRFEQPSKIKWARFVAHEAFHLFNAQHVRPRLGRRDAWLSEGAAELFGLRALVAVGYLSHAQLDTAMVQATNDCLLRQKGRAIQTAQDAEVPYSCGAMLQYWMNDALRRSSDGALKIEDVAARVFAAAARGDGTYSTDEYLVAMRELTPETDLQAIETLLTKGVSRGADALLLAQSRAAGLDVVLAPFHSATLPPSPQGSLAGFSGMLVRLIARCDCGDAISVTARRVYAQFHPVPECRKLRYGMKLAKVNGYDLYAQAPDAYASSLARAKHGKPLELMGYGESADPTLVVCRDLPVDDSFTQLLELKSAGHTAGAVSTPPEPVRAAP